MDFALNNLQRLICWKNLTNFNQASVAQGLLFWEPDTSRSSNERRAQNYLDPVGNPLKEFSASGSKRDYTEARENLGVGSAPEATRAVGT